ncbi:TPA: ArsR family transcriptional regulator [Candidatus Bathyarchaeota archaeon]|nr:ArsR family transcriptional regulator [Candidatus Bathyarchaeota archaeon]
MALPHRIRGVKVLKAISSPLRLQVLNFLFDKGALSYTELMNSLKMNPSRDAGRFAYHLKFLLKSDLVEADVESKKYVLTELGKMVIDVADRVEKKAFKPKGMLVRTSHSTLEMFEANKIADSLIKEGKMPVDLAQRTAKEAEKILLKSKIRYLTAPLVREIVNAILVEKGLEDYRHKLTRLGMPVHEVCSLVEGKTDIKGSASILAKAGGNTLSEYALLHAFPRDISDAHVSGSIHVNELETWLLKPEEVLHDIRIFLQNGLKPSNPAIHPQNSPEDFESALAVIFNALLHTSLEINRMQTCLYFNVFLAPFAKGADISRLRNSLRVFILNINQHFETTFGVSPLVPSFVADKQAIGPQGKINGKYGDFEEESCLLAQLVIDVFLDLSIARPLLNPKLIVEVSDLILSNERTRNILLTAHAISAEKGAVYFLNTPQKERKLTLFSGLGCRYENELTGDWETDALRTGCIGIVNINLPRIAQESEKDRSKFFEILKERLELATRALRIKQRALKQHGKTSLQFLSQSTNGDPYFRFDSCSSIVNLVGFKEAMLVFSQEPSPDAELARFAEETAQTIQSSRGKTGRKQGKRLFTAILPSQEASERLAQLDIEKFGLAKTIFSGDREKPFYSSVNRLRVEEGDSLGGSPYSAEPFTLRSFSSGGSLAVIELNNPEYKAEELLNLTAKLMENHFLEFFTYNRRISYCQNCGKSHFGTLHKCPACGAVSSLAVLDRFSHT